MTKQSEANTDDKNLVKAEEESQREQASPQPEKSSAKAEKKPSNIVARLSLLLMLIILLSLGGGGYYFYELSLKQTKQLKNQQRQISNIQRDLDQAQQSISSSASQGANITRELTALTEKVVQTEDISQRAMEIINRSQRDWVIAEVDYLLRMASQRLAVARDIQGAVAALKGADKRLSDLGDLRLLKIRKQLAKDIAMLSSIQQADVNGISMGIDELINHVAELPYKSAKEEIKAQLENKAPAEVVADGNQDLLDSIMSTVKQIGDIKVHKRSIKTASSSEQQLQIEQQLRSYLLSARIAVLSMDEKQFRHDIKLTIELLNHFYDTTDNRVQTLLGNLTEYEQIQLRPDLPELTAAWDLLQKQMILEKSSDLNVEEDEAQASKATATQEEKK